MSAFSNRDFYCPKCGGWLECDENEVWYCDTCEYEKRPSIGKYQPAKPEVNDKLKVKTHRKPNNGYQDIP